MELIAFIDQAFRKLKQFIVSVINGFISFLKNIVGWFKELILDQEKDIPFVINAKDPKFKEMLKNAPVKNVGIMNGVYNEETEEITHHEYLAADGIDSQTRETIGDEAIVVLT